MSQVFTDNCFDPNNVAQTDLQNIENNFAALKSQFSGSGAPANPVAGMPWVDLTRHMLCVRNEANDAWLDIFNLATGVPAGMSTNADTVDNIHASTTATANKLLALNGSGVMPCSITGNAGTASALTATLNISGGGTGATTANGAANNLSVVKRDHGHNQVGSFCLARESRAEAAVLPGDTIEGSFLTVFAKNASDNIYSYGQLSGTWRCLGYFEQVGTIRFALFQRIS